MLSYATLFNKWYTDLSRSEAARKPILAETRPKVAA